MQQIMSTNFIENIQEYCGTDSNEVVLAVPLHFGNREKTQIRYNNGVYDITKYDTYFVRWFIENSAKETVIFFKWTK